MYQNENCGLGYSPLVDETWQGPVYEGQASSQPWWQTAINAGIDIFKTSTQQPVYRPPAQRYEYGMPDGPVLMASAGPSPIVLAAGVLIVFLMLRKK